MSDDEYEPTRARWLTPGTSLHAEPSLGGFSACLGWANVDEKPYGYVLGYRRAADLLFERISTMQDLDTLVFPFVFI